MLVLYDIDPLQRPMVFPPLHLAWGDGTPAPGLVARGGDLSVERLKLAYSQGIFPWFSEGEPILWWSLDPRMVLYPQNFKVSRSLRKTLRHFLKRGGCEITIDTAFSTVIENCAAVKRSGQSGTWIDAQIIQAYTKLHQCGMAHSFEVWVHDELVGGLYGVNIGGMFYGESMFTRHNDASKLALCGLIAFARHFQIQLIDCQQATSHLSSLGGCTIPRDQFIVEMKLAQKLKAPEWVAGVLPGLYWKTLTQ